MGLQQTQLDNLRIVLVRPLYGGNVGSVCRAMRNMGLSDLAVVGPCDLDEEEGRKMACSAGDLFEGRRMFDSLADAVADCGLVVGTTARLGLYRQHALPPREQAEPILSAATNARVAIIFGPEDNGLSNEDLAICSRLIRIPTAIEYSSLNLSQAVLLCCYEMFIATDVYEHLGEKSPEATSEMRERMYEMWADMLLKIGFMEDDKAEHMMLAIRRIFGRGQLTEDDARILMGVARQACWAAGHQVENQAPAQDEVSA